MVPDGLYAAHGARGETMTWSYADGVLTVSGSGIMNSYSADSPAPWMASYGADITSVVLGSGVSTVGANAFSGCTALVDITFADSVTAIGDGAFNACTGLTSVTIPASVTSVADDAFQGCTNLAGLSVTCATAGYTYAAGSGLTVTVTHQNLQHLDAVTVNCGQDGNVDCWYCCDCEKYYSDAAFTSEITRADTVIAAESLGYGHCGSEMTWVLKKDGTLVISGSGEMDFDAEYCSEAAPDPADDECPEEIPVEMSFKGIEYAPWYDLRDRIDTVEIEDGITSIAPVAFKDCTALTSVSIPSSVEKIGERAFENCVSLTDTTLPDGVKTLPTAVFCNCESLETVVLPAALRTVNYAAFDKCNSLSTVYYTGTSWRSITIYSANTALSAAGRVTVTSETQLVLPNALTTIADSAFCDTDAVSVRIPDKCTSIGEDAFADCPNLVAVYLPEGLSEYEGCFTNSNGLQIQFIYR